MCLLYNFLHITVELKAVLEGVGFKPNYFGKTRYAHYSSSGMQVLSGLSRSQTQPVRVLHRIGWYGYLAGFTPATSLPRSENKL
jgi:hypothetical protein